MKYEAYTHLKAADDLSMIDFISNGPKGPIDKRILFSVTELEGVYNLTFGDIDKDGQVDDYSISNNGDRNKILATIAKVVKDYTDKYPGRLIVFKGSTAERTRLYRMAISLHFDELSTQFHIYAYVDDKILPFHKDLQITAFLIKRKLYTFTK